VHVGHPHVAELGLLVPHVEHVVRRPLPVGFEQADTLSDSRHHQELQVDLVLVGLVLDFDLDHALLIARE
jgi:hypothetical protein